MFHCLKGSGMGRQKEATPRTSGFCFQKPEPIVELKRFAEQEEHKGLEEAKRETEGKRALPRLEDSFLHQDWISRWAFE